MLIGFSFLSGFLRSDSLIGTATVKLADLLGRCVVHQAVDVSDNLGILTNYEGVNISLFTYSLWTEEKPLEGN